MKLVQKRFLNGSREFEIIDDAVYVRIKGLLKEEKMTVGLSMLMPEPVTNGSELEFHSREQQGPLLSLFLDTPNAEEFNAFVDTLKQRIPGKQSISGEGNADAGVASAAPILSRSEALDWNVNDEPPDFAEHDEAQPKIDFQPVNPERVQEDIVMLQTYVTDEEIQSLLAALEVLRAEPGNERAFQKVVDDFNELGIHQGAVLTYASYLKVLLSQSVS